MQIITINGIYFANDFRIMYTPRVTHNKPAQQRQRREARKIVLRNPRILLSLSLTLVTLYVSIFAEIPLTPASPPERNDGR